jgi:hypothetical protein
MIRAVAAGAVLAMGMASSAWASTIYYGTGIAANAAPGSDPNLGNDPNNGGICVFSASDCLTGTEGSAGSLTQELVTINGYNLIQLTASPNYGIGNYFLSITLGGQGGQPNGSVWDISLVNSTGTAGTNLGYTTIVPSIGGGSTGGGTVTAIVSGNGTFDIGITDLFEHYQGIRDTLPTDLNPASTDDGALNTTVSSTDAGFSFSFILTPMPEPASVVLFVSAIAVLGAVRRRSRMFTE